MNEAKAKIESATLADAIAYADSDEQYTFCIDYLEISAHNRSSDALVEALEDRFGGLLEEFQKAISA